MRDFIKGTGGFFVVIGMIVMVVGVCLAMMGSSAAAGEGGILGGLVMAFAAAAAGGSFAMFGGVAYMLCVIDERLEASARARRRELAAAPAADPVAVSETPEVF